MGMEVHPFDRLARAVDALASAEPNQEYFIQLGSCTFEPRFARWTKFLSFGEVCENIRNSEAVITHAGAGSTLVCLQQGKHPIMVPRRSREKEHVDEHQVPFAEKLSRFGMATMVTEMDELPRALVAVRGKSASAVGKATELTDWLEYYWQTIVRGKRT